MELTVNSHSKADFARISFLREQVVLHGVSEVVLSYAETELNVELYLDVSTRKLPMPRNKPSYISRLEYTPHVSQITLTFCTEALFIPITILGSEQFLFSLLEEKHPFKKFSYEFKNKEADIVRHYFAQELTRRLEDHKAYGIHTEIPVRAIREGEQERVLYAPESKQTSSDFLSAVMISVVIGGGLLLCGGLGYYLAKHWNNDVICWSFAVGICIFVLLDIILLLKMFRRHLIKKKLEAAKKGNTKN